MVLAGETPDQLQHMADSAAALGLPAYLVKSPLAQVSVRHLLRLK